MIHKIAPYGIVLNKVNFNLQVKHILSMDQPSKFTPVAFYTVLSITIIQVYLIGIMNYQIQMLIMEQDCIMCMVIMFKLLIRRQDPHIIICGLLFLQLFLTIKQVSNIQFRLHFNQNLLICLNQE